MSSVVLQDGRAKLVKPEARPCGGCRIGFPRGTGLHTFGDDCQFKKDMTPQRQDAVVPCAHCMESHVVRPDEPPFGDDSFECHCRCHPDALTPTRKGTQET